MRWLAIFGFAFAVGLSAAGCGAETPKGPTPAAADSAQAAATPGGATTGVQGATTPVPGGSAAPSPQALDTSSAVDRPAAPNAVEKPASSSDKDIKDAKPSAPATVSAAIRPGAADISVAFGADGSSVLIKVWGVDGLKVTKGATPTALASVKSGESSKVAVQFTAPTTECNLAVSVSGTFGGREQTKVQSFTINAGSPKAAPPVGTSATDKDGRAVKVMKAK